MPLQAAFSSSTSSTQTPKYHHQSDIVRFIGVDASLPMLGITDAVEFAIFEDGLP